MTSARVALPATALKRNTVTVLGGQEAKMSGPQLMFWNSIFLKKAKLNVYLTFFLQKLTPLFWFAPPRSSLPQINFSSTRFCQENNCTIQWKVCGASNRLPFRPQKDAVTLVFKRWMEGTNGDLNAFSMAFAHFGSSAKNIPTTLLALPHETLMSKHFQREFWTLHFIYS